MCCVFGRSGSVEAILRFVQLVQLSTSLLVVTRPSFAGSSERLQRRDVLQVLEDGSAPRFDAIIFGIDAHLGETILLPCTVRNMGDKVVSWMRRSDLSILTSGELTFSADSRFESVHNAAADFWGLRIRGVRPTDAGQYECQVNTDPKMNLAVNLSIIDNRHLVTESAPHFTSRAHIKSSKEISARLGSTLSLTCEIAGDDAAVEDPLMKKARVRWLHDAKEITSKVSTDLFHSLALAPFLDLDLRFNGSTVQFDEGGISVETDYRQGRICSRLIINIVLQRHAGRYTCMRYATKEDTVKLKITDFEHVEAMQRDSAYFSSSARSSVRTLTFGIYLLLYII